MRRKLTTLDGKYIYVEPADVAVLACTNVLNTTAVLVRMCPQPFMVQGSPTDVDRVLRGEIDAVTVEDEPSRLVT